MDKKKKILILGGKPIGSYDIVNYANSLGVHTIVTDYLDVSESAAKSIASENWNISTADTDLLIEKIVEHNIDAIFTGIHEFNISKTLSICEALNLPFYASGKQLELTTNKHIYKEIFFRHGMPAIPQYFVGDPIDFLENKEKDKLDFPVIVKPVNGSAGFGVEICNGFDDLTTAVNKSAKYSKSSQILIEKLIDNEEISIFYIIKDGVIKLSCVSDRETYKFDDKVIPLPVNYTFPSVYTDTFINNYNDKVIKSLESMGLKNGMVFLQAFRDNGLCYIYDMGFRLTGTQEYNIISRICGYNPLEMMVDYSLTGKMGNDNNLWEKIDPYLKGLYAANMTFLLNKGVIAEFVGVDDLDEIEGVEKVVLNHNIGFEVADSAIGTLVQVGLRVFIITDSLKKLEVTREYIRSVVDVRDIDGNSMLIK